MTPIDVARAFIAAINAHDLAALAALMAPDHVFVDALDGRVTGREAMAGAWVNPARRRTRRADPQLKGLEDELRRALGTKVTLTARKKGGRIVIEYFSPEDLTRLLTLLGAG